MDDPTTVACRTCGKSNFYPVGVAATGGPLVILLGFWKTFTVRSNVCLSCGTIVLAVDEKALDTLRAAKDKLDARRAAR